MVQESTARPIKVGLLWHSANSGNLGVGALTIANLAIVREVAAELGFELEPTIIGMRDGGAPYVPDDEARRFPVTFRSLLSPSGCWAVIGRQDCMLDIGAGDSFADIYGPKRFGFLWLTKVFSLLRRKPLLLSPQTIGPFSRSPYKELARFALERADAVIVRDAASFEFLQTIAPKAKGVLAVDVAFALPFEDQGLRTAPRAPLNVGVNVSGLLLAEAESGRNRFGLEVDYASLMRRLVGDLCARDDVQVHLVTHANGGAGDLDDDGWATSKFAAEFPKAYRVPDFTGPVEAKSYISGLDFLVAGRMHACIAAYSSGTPVVPVAYSRKFSGLFDMLDYRWLVPVRGMSTDEALDYLHRCIGDRRLLASDAVEGMKRVSALLDNYRNELRALFKSLGARR